MIQWGRTFAWLLIMLGFALRVSTYLANRSLWWDEAALALNIVERSLAGLLRPLSHGQGAPPGFLAVQKAAVELFGNNEYALRLFPLLCGLLSLIIFYALVRRVLDWNGVLIGTGLFAFLPHLIRYSTEAKQYASDVAAALLLVLAALSFSSKGWTAGRSLAFGVIGAAAIWFSHPAVFVLAGAGLTLAVHQIRNGKWDHLLRLLPALVLWGASFTVLYFASLRALSRNDLLLTYWAGDFAPLWPLSASHIAWYVKRFFSVLADPGGISFTGLAAFLLLTGGYRLLRERELSFIFLLSPVPFTLLASMLHSYPFQGRLLLFLVPVLVLFIAAGAAYLSGLTWSVSPLIAGVLLLLLFCTPVGSTVQAVLRGFAKEEIRPVMAQLQENRQQDDVIYVYHGALPAFRYYSDRYGFTPEDYIVGRRHKEDWMRYMDELDQLRGEPRVWVVFSHVSRLGEIDEEKIMLRCLDSIGTRRQTFRAAGAAAYLYDLS